jgi:hypothetical protein
MTAAYRPYIACWRGILSWNRNSHGEFSAHHSFKAACDAAIHHCDAWNAFWPTRLPWYAFLVIDARSGQTLFVAE